MQHTIRLFLALLMVCVWLKGAAQSPTDLTANVNLPDDVPNTYTNSTSGTATFSAVSQVAAAFNYGRRQEEIQLGLPVNSLGNLSLPAGFAAATQQEQSLYLINQERIARAGQNYPGSASVLGLPLTGLETNLSGMAQAHAEDMVNNGFFGHIGSNGNNPFDRIASNPAYSSGCRNTTFGYAENIYRNCTFSSVPPAPGATPLAAPFLAAQAIFSWLYRDAGSLWGHRRAILIQNTDVYLSGTAGYNNDYGQISSEGFLGIGVFSVVDYASCVAPTGFYNTGGYVVVMNVADPVNNASCPYQLDESPLPVELVSFLASKEQHNAMIRWSTTQETNSSGFEIQHSVNAKNWSTVGTVAAAGESKTIVSYEFLHTEPVKGDNFYRLRMIDRDGTFTYSRIQGLRFNGLPEPGIALYPNPASNDLFVRDADLVQGVTVRDIGGKLAFQADFIDPVTGKLSVETIPSGLYIVNITLSNGLVSSHKILIKR
jgi:uncharacterized protein YkwD